MAAVLASSMAIGCFLFDAPPTWSGRLAREERTLNSSATSAQGRYYALADAAKAAFEVGELERAERYATELLQLSTRYQSDWNYGNAVHDAHMVLGRLALRNRDRDGAAAQLKQAGDTPGSPQLNSFGPNMSLAADLLKAGERDAVLAYFDQCDRFWELGHDDLARWRALVQGGQQPDFGANLVY